MFIKEESFLYENCGVNWLVAFSVLKHQSLDQILTMSEDEFLVENENVSRDTLRKIFKYLNNA
jgi:hypothetical protein